MSDTAQVNRGTPNGQAKRRLRNLLIDRSFQLRWVVRIILIVTVIVSVMGYFLYRTVADATDQMLAQKLGDLELTEASIQAFVSQAESDKALTIYTLAAWLVALAVVVSGAVIVLTHKVAGPVFKMRRIFRTINDDNLYLQGKLRKGDELKEAFEDFDDMLRRLREQRKADLEIMSRYSEVKASGNVSESQQAEMDKLIEKFRDSIRLKSTPP